MTDTSDPGGESAVSDDDGADDSAPAVDAAEVEHVAELARVRLEEGETETFADQFAEILEYFEALDEVPNLDREEELVNVMREDEVEAGLTQAEALANAAETEDGYFVGPKVS
ncbi:Asp-tRNA(Asn)/Glu-tRNA(Gln) amidotransferase subunit GatC [Halorubrum sp. AD140]|uniref:Asp-tRNA(Asn)/Glu-tRNA(Gln) amidotransferase subunit GatC n=1 Tax=Halorubrum sp. AD140 TaxID=3050073 RepID=UPI002ACC96D8|nr:Asp-tRNA(Asn)/Glu-tRNA(Gln) amidotransferase subunit GatC [Halorubrum sp. AD140]MDZ5810098.1 Asp-tRNA(Asn)/Glu-tRNA(Gln) amidotransferase subunit GatC [Halorubrum sp. AD140]